eukprot:CAMPEP_0184664060 /NCGR_PEP_ID=MMETSP0308-20130426/51026_1 /TAXON_ID=38269 /ORGANISM="Gloeochaete witrockiana, Strain SAG 46.84" /LENGTH=472 /DNA_ID=CAMNT_0027107217 /DNA_START=185 /DNA_END=1603 /DNA_ORIENTATION=+
MQLQGELVRAGTATVMYSNAVDCLWKTAKIEGVAGLTRGLGMAVVRDGVVNGLKLGLYDPILSMLHKPSQQTNGGGSKRTSPPFWKRMAAGALTGAMGAIPAAPFEILKSRAQSQTVQSSARAVDLLRSLTATSGPLTLFKGVAPSMVRSAISTSITLSSYFTFREVAVQRNWLPDGPICDTVSSFFAAAVSTVFVNPIDVVRTRLYNQSYGVDGRGAVYKNALHAFGKVLSKEGPAAFFKGLFSNFLARGPGMAISFSVFESLRKFARTSHESHQRKQRLKRVFQFFDRDKDGLIDLSDLTVAYMAACPRSTLSPPPQSDSKYKSLIRKAVSDIMTKGDADRSGSLDFKKFLAVSDDLTAIVSREQMVQVFRALHDKQGEGGKVSSAELVMALKKVAPLSLQSSRLQQSVAEYDQLIKLNAERMMTYADKDRDGKVDFHDFEKMVTGLQHADIDTTVAVRSWLLQSGVPIE